MTDERERQRLLESLQAESGEAEWTRLGAGMRQAEQDARTHGVCMSLGEFHRDINSIAVPMVLPGGEIMALNCGGPAYAFSKKTLRSDVAPVLIETARAIALDVGGMVPLPGKLLKIS
jgi:DNA-binding IclR family transcriptional regulator